MSRYPNDQNDDQTVRQRDESDDRDDDRAPRRSDNDRYDRRPRSSGIGGVLISIFGTIAILAVVAFLARDLIAKILVSAITPPPVAILPTAGPTPTPKITTGPMVIKQIQQLNRLETSSYSVQTVVTAEKPGNILGIGHEKLLLIIHGTVVAGIDLGELRLQDITILEDGKRIKLRLPAAKIFSSHLNEGQTQLYDDSTALFTKPDPNLVIEAQKKGVQAILKTACEDGILRQASEQGRHAVGQFMEFAGFEHVEFEDAPTPSCAATTSAVP